MTRRERLEAKHAKREDWAGRAQVRAAERFKKADPSEAATGIPLGQPILVGHHSERRHRAVVDRIARNMTKGIEETKLATHHAAKADGLAHQLDTSIFSDDPDAVERLTEKRTALEVERDHMKAANAYYKKHRTLFASGAEGGPNIPDAIRDKGVRNLAAWRGVYGQPFPSYALTNIGARIRAAAKRAEAIPKANAEREARQAAAEAAGGCAIAYSKDREYCAVTFSEKPARVILDALRTAFFSWSGGSWSGPVSRLPACVQALALPTPPRVVAGEGSGVASGSPVSPLSGGDAGEATPEPHQREATP